MSKTITMNRKGMVLIPASLRKKYQFHEGSKFIILDIEGKLELIPIYDDFTEIQQICPTREEFQKSYEESREVELELENRI